MAKSATSSLIKTFIKMLGSAEKNSQTICEEASIHKLAKARGLWNASNYDPNWSGVELKNIPDREAYLFSQQYHQFFSAEHSFEQILPQHLLKSFSFQFALVMLPTWYLCMINYIVNTRTKTKIDQRHKIHIQILDIYMLV